MVILHVLCVLLAKSLPVYRLPYAFWTSTICVSHIRKQYVSAALHRQQQQTSLHSGRNLGLWFQGSFASSRKFTAVQSCAAWGCKPTARTTSLLIFLCASKVSKNCFEDREHWYPSMLDIKIDNCCEQAKLQQKNADQKRQIKICWPHKGTSCKGSHLFGVDVLYTPSFENAAIASALQW